MHFNYFGRGRSVLCFWIIFFIIGGGLFINWMYNSIKLSKQTQSVIRILYDITNDFRQKKVSTKCIFDSESYGEKAVFLDSLLKISAETINMQTELEKVSIEVISKDLNTLFSNKDEFSKIQYQIKDCINKFQQISKKRELISKEVKNIINQMNISQKEKDELIAGFDISNKEYTTLYQAYLENEIVLFTVLYKQYEYLKKNQNVKFKYEDGRLIFYGDSDLKEYNEITKEIDDIEKREGELIKNISDRKKS